jgi:hypothetical protein
MIRSLDVFIENKSCFKYKQYYIQIFTSEGLIMQMVGTCTNFSQNTHAIKL